MGDVVPLIRPDDYKRARLRIKKLWEQGNVVITDHAQKRMIERKLESTDLQYLIRNGQVVAHCKVTHLWRYTLKGHTVDGVSATCQVEVNGYLIIVTVTKGGRR